MVSNANRAFAAALIAALADLGLNDVCLSPGSRNTPLSLAVAEHDSVRTWVHHDERSAGFFAVGLARATDRPVAVMCTSGTAATEYLPAVTEASLSRVPLLVITADRPPELRDVGAPQAIDQIKLYGDAVRWFHQGAPPDAASVRHAPHLAAQAWGAAVDVPSGPVHLNLPFREPLAADSPRIAVPAPPSVRVGIPTPSPQDVAAVAAMLDGRRTLFVVGAASGEDAAAIADLARRLAVPVFADPQSQLRAGPDCAVAVPHADLLATAGALDAHPPEVVVRWGSLPTSKGTWRWLEQHGEIDQISIDPGGHRDPIGSSRLFVRAGLAATARALEAGPSPEGWSASWDHAAAAAAAAVAAVLDDEPFPNEPAIAATVFRAAGEDAALFCGSSMPIRDIDAFAGVRPDPLRVVANRGANGIDGSISTAAGVAASGTPTVALIGDVAALHDLGALAMVGRLALPLTIVVVHNDGGGIFELLPQAEGDVVDRSVFELLFGTPHGTDFIAVAGALGFEADAAATQDDLAELVGEASSSPRLVQVRTERSRIAPLRRKVVAAVRTALES